MMADPIRIALIDDDAAILDSLRLYFERRKLKVSCFNTSNEFMAAIDSSAQFDCVVSDVRMPGMSGLELVGHLKTRNLNRPIVLITGHGDIDMAVSAIKMGAFDFIEKPCDETRLLASIINAVEQCCGAGTTAFPVQFAVAPPTSSHGTYRRRAVEQGNRNAAQSKCEDSQQPPSMGYGANWRPKSRRTCADGHNHPGAAIECLIRHVAR
jgi:DNA-binding response OmpR family regulator